MSREDNGLQKAISRLSGAEGTIHLAEIEPTASRQQARALGTFTDSSEDLAKDSLDKNDGPTVVDGDLEAGKAFELTDQTLVSGNETHLDKLAALVVSRSQQLQGFVFG
jgi:hypothetical protein